MDAKELYSQVIKDHNMFPHNKRKLDFPSITVPGNNPSCGDEVELSVIVKDGKIADAAFSGVGCAISQASISIMIDVVRGKSVTEARHLCDLFIGMIRGKVLSEEEQEELSEAIALANVSTMPARAKCATMPWYTLRKALDRLEEEKSGANEK